jgi:conjugal transfer pilus assembly protein TraD
MKQPQDDTHALKTTLLLGGGAGFYKIYDSLTGFDKCLMVTGTTGILTIAGLYAWDRYSKYGRNEKKRLEQLKSIPLCLLRKKPLGVSMGVDEQLRASIFLPDFIRLRHIHLMGATGSGKTESVILNFLQQDTARGLGTIILDAKGDASFLKELKTCVHESKLKVFDLGSEVSLGYDPLEVGSPLESAQRLFSSLTWSEEYYKSKALSTLQRLFQIHFDKHGKNPRLIELTAYLETPLAYAAVAFSENYPKKMAEADFMELSGLRDQIRSLCIGHLAKTLSPIAGKSLNLKDAETGTVIYFRLQSLMSPQLVTTLGKLIINHLGYLAGSVHRTDASENHERSFVPVYFDEFASFACPEFADLISKARSAGYALTFSHQSTGDVAEVSKGFLSQITDNTATKIIMRINDPDSADFFARTFGTKLVQKVTQRITNAKEVDTGVAAGEGSQREVHQFRAPADGFKTLPTGVGSVLIAHGEHTTQGASHVFKIKFPKLNRKENAK